MSHTARDEVGVVTSYYASCIPGLYASMRVGHGPPQAHVYDRFALVALTAGEAVVWCGGEEHRLRPGDLWVIEPGDVQRELPTTRYVAVSLTLNAKLVRSLTERAAGTARLPVAIADVSPLVGELCALADGIKAQRERAWQRRRLETLIGALEPLWDRAVTRPEPALVVRARRTLADPSGGALSLRELSRRLGCAPGYLCRVFSEHTGIGPHAYQLQQRLLEAARLIESGRTVACAATLAGFSDESHLRRHFRRRFGVAPGRYQHALAVNHERASSCSSARLDVEHAEVERLGGGGSAWDDDLNRLDGGGSIVGHAFRSPALGLEAGERNGG
jgi:AraC-like DNA-binding protein